ncbi:hypothetical protein TWF718_001871 [Orbilia javanica]|uniref:Uncharacterized protein n=1 Tax=Orbilia javanica TaxID=47235 RepID=A0AAN8MZJ8_9PEZI
MYAHRRQKGEKEQSRQPGIPPHLAQIPPKARQSVAIPASQHKVSQSGGTGIPRFHSSFFTQQGLDSAVKRDSTAAQKHNISGSKHMLTIIWGKNSAPTSPVQSDQSDQSSPT